VLVTRDEEKRMGFNGDEALETMGRMLLVVDFGARA